jgi:hypothetical protein
VAHFQQPQPVAAGENPALYPHGESMKVDVNIFKLAPPERGGKGKKINCSLGGAGSRAENSIVYKLRRGRKEISKKWTVRMARLICTAYTISYAALLFCCCRTGGQSMPNLIT